MNRINRDSEFLPGTFVLVERTLAPYNISPLKGWVGYVTEVVHCRGTQQPIYEFRFMNTREYYRSKFPSHSLKIISKERALELILAAGINMDIVDSLMVFV